MSVKALSAVFEDSRAEGKAFTALLAMADWADHNGWCYPSYSQIAAKARMSRATAIEAVKELVALGELERRPKGKAPSSDDHDDDPITVRAQYRNEYRILLVKPKKAVQPPDHISTSARDPKAVQSDDYLSAPIDHAQVVQSDAEGGPNGGQKVVQNGGSHIRIRPSGRPSDLTTVRESAAAPPLGAENHADEADEKTPVPTSDSTPDPADPLDAFRLAWNELTTEPLPRCHSLTPRRRQRIRACLVERPIEAWREIFARMEASTFLHQNERGWYPSLDWVIAGPDAALKVLEGHFDDRQRRHVADPAAYEFRCPHNPPCTARHACSVKTMLEQARAAS